MKSIKTSILAIVSSVMLFTSCNYLDVSDYFEDLVNLDSVFQSKVYLEKYLWGAAALLPDEANIFEYSYYPAILGSDCLLYTSSCSSLNSPIALNPLNTLYGLPV